MPLATLLLLAATIPRASQLVTITTTLILRNGTQFVVNGPIREEQSRVIFRTAGALYSIPMSDVDLDATRAAVTKAVVTNDGDKKLKVSTTERDRLLHELEQNHSGKASASGSGPRIEHREAETGASESRETAAPPKGDEWSWRTAARAHEEAIRQAKENVELLRSRSDALKRQIAQFFALGYRSNQFSYQSSELQITLDQLPGAELEVTRAQRANDQFRDDARRQGIMPGWLR